MSIIECKYCNKIVEKRKDSKSKYCSRQCWHRQRSNDGTIKRNCKICGKEFFGRKSIINRGGEHGAMCSYKCRNINNKRNPDFPRGKKHHWFIDGKCHDRYYGIDWLKTRELVLIRDNYKCKFKECDKKAVDVHHLIPFRIVKENKSVNLFSCCKHHHAQMEKYFRDNIQIIKCNEVLWNKVSEIKKKCADEGKDINDTFLEFIK